MLSSLLTVLPLVADGAAPASGVPPQAGQGLFQYLPILMIAFLFYFMLWRPQEKKRKETQDMLKALKKGDEVVTSGGLIGRITGMTDSTITLEVQEKVRLKVLRSHITGPLGASLTGQAAAPASSKPTPGNGATSAATPPADSSAK